MPYVCSSGDVGFEVGDDAPSICVLGLEWLFSQRELVVLCEGFPRRASIRFFWGDGWVVGLETGDYEPVEEAIVERRASVVECEHLALVQRVRDDDLRHFLVFELRTYPYRTSLVSKPSFENSTKCLERSGWKKTLTWILQCDMACRAEAACSAVQELVANHAAGVCG